MKIRDKLLLGFGLYILLAFILGFFAYKELGTINKRLILVETADDITNTILEVRRYEKNFLLYKDEHSFREAREYLAKLIGDIDNIRAEIIDEIGSGSYEALRRDIAEFDRVIDSIALNFSSQEKQTSLVREAGRRVEHTLSGAALQSFLVLRRYEKNVMLYRTADSFAVFNKTYNKSEFVNREDARRYAVLVAKLYQLYETEHKTVESLRKTAREIQSFTENLSRKERMDISTIIKMSINLLVIALVLIIIIGTIINIKLANSIAKPIVKLERITNKINRGDFSETIEVRGHDEIASLASSFNQMELNLDNAMTSLEEIIEKLQQKQDQLVEAEKLAAVGKLAAGVAHEINNPLTSVLTFSNLMLEQCPPSDPRHEKLKLMARETNRARNIVRQLLNFGREIVIKPVRINVNEPVSEIVDSLVAQDAFKGIELGVNLARELPDVNADPAQIGQVVMNMLLNAIHSITPPGKIEVATQSSGKSVEIIFSDTGKGIPEAHVRKIFDPFFTTKDASKGTGLGLAVSYGIIKKHSGDIEVVSAEGEGTTFTVRLPVYG
jgi:two-component system NtrC family sensor kinase